MLICNDNGNKGKILFLATVYTHLANFHIPFIQFLQNKGYEVHAAASPDEGGKEEVEASGAKCWEIHFSRSPYSLKNLQALNELRHLFKTNRFDLIHVHTPIAAFLGRYIAKATNQGPVLYTAHGFHFYKGAPLINWFLYYPMERLASRWTDGLIVINREDFESASRLGFEQGKNLFYVPGVGVDLAQYSVLPSTEKSIRSKLDISNSDIVVTCVAEMSPNKNHKFLLEAWKGLAAAYSNCHLLLVGKGEMMSVLRGKVRREKIPRVHFLGLRRDVPQILSESDIVTLTSKREGLPKSILEAMAAGKPVVATNVRGNRELVEHGKTGFLIELGDTQQLYVALKMLIENKELRTEMGESGRKKVKDYSLEKVLKKMETIYILYLDYFKISNHDN